MEPGTRSLQTVRELLCNPARRDMALRLMLESDCWGGMLARKGGDLLSFSEKERDSVLTTVSRHLRFLDSLAIANSVSRSTFSPSDLLQKKMTIYFVLPPEHMRAQASLMRLWIGSSIRGATRRGLQNRNRVHFVLDESASLGQMDCIDDAIDKLRAYGLKLQFYYQGMGQLKKCFPEDEGQTLLSNATQVFFGVNDNVTAEYVSKRIGDATAVVDSGGTSSGWSTSWSHGAQSQQGGGGSGNVNENWSLQARPLLKPDEVMAQSPRTAFTFIPGMAPIRTTLLRYYEERWLRRPPGRFRRFFAASCMLLASIGMCAISMTVAAVFTLSNRDNPAFREIAPPEIVEWLDQLELR